jgi:HlyD family secretion protein
MVTPDDRDSVELAEAPASKVRSRWAAIAALAVIAVGGWLLIENRRLEPATGSVQADGAVRNEKPVGIGCTGRVEPAGGIIVVAVAPLLGRTAVVARLLVAEGDVVQPGQSIATLDSLPDLEAAVKQAASRVAVAQSRLAQLEAGARPGDVLALQSEIAKLELESSAAQRELERKDALARKDLVPLIQVDAARLKTQETERSLDVARRRLESLTQVRESDLNVAKAEVASSRADLDRARVQAQAGTVRAPASGRVVRVSAHAGEAVGQEGIVTLAGADRMNVIAEIYETDIARVRPGQKAVITSDWLSAPMEGVVEWISPQIEKRVLPSEPAAAADQRVYEARVRMARPEFLAQRIHSKVNVRIEP